MTIARRLAKYVQELDFADLPPEVIREAKRVVLDTLGCAFGGYPSEASRIIQSLAEELDGPQESTIIGSGLRTSCLNALLANGTMARYLDYNDYRMITLGGWPTGGHPSDIIPGTLALGERQHSSGKDVITAIVIGYEIYGRLSDSELCPIEKRGWAVDTKGVYVMPLVAGKLLKLDEGQLENAVGISGSHNMVLGILDAAGEELTMTKNLRFPRTAYGGVMAALMAKRGFTGPTRVLEGNKGFAEVVMGGDFDLDKLVEGGPRFRILDTSIKAFCADGTNLGHLSATQALIREHDIKPEDVAQVKLWASTRCVGHCGEPLKRHPKNKETADHSAYYTTAILIIDRALGPGQYAPQKLQDPKVRELINRISIEADPELDRFGPAGISEITTRRGAVYKRRVDYPRGDSHNPMTDQELEDKFCQMASVYMSQQQMREVISRVYQLEELDDIGELMTALVFK